jgi:hypothetical protein
MLVAGLFDFQIFGTNPASKEFIQRNVRLHHFRPCFVEFERGVFDALDPIRIRQSTWYFAHEHAEGFKRKISALSGCCKLLNQLSTN